MLSTRATVWALVLGAALVASAAADELKVSGVAKSLMVRCDSKHGHVSVESSRSVVTVLGECKTVGTRDQVSVTASDTLLVDGIQNTVEYWSNLAGTARPHVFRPTKSNQLVAR